MNETENVCEFNYNSTGTVSFLNNAKSKERFAKQIIMAYVLFGKRISKHVERESPRKA